MQLGLLTGLVVLALSRQCIGASFFDVTCATNGDMTVTITDPAITGGLLFATNDPVNCKGTTGTLTIILGTCNGAYTNKGNPVDVTYQYEDGVVSKRDIYQRVSCTTAFNGFIIGTQDAFTLSGLAFTHEIIAGNTFNPGGISLTFSKKQVTLGESVNLIVKLTNSDSLRHKIMPYNCEVRFGNEKTITILDDRCPTIKEVKESDVVSDQEVKHEITAFGLGSGPSIGLQYQQFKCTIGVCGIDETNTTHCLKRNDCVAISRRRRRAAVPERDVTVTGRLLVYDPSKKTIQGDTNTLSTSAVATIGSSAGAAFILLSAFFIVLGVRIRRRRQSNSDKFPVPQVTEISQTPVGDRFVTEEEEGRHQEVGVVNSAFETSP